MTPNLETTYLGLSLAHPVVASAGPWTHEADGFRRLEEAGVSAIVMHSLFEEEITRQSLLTHHFIEYGAESFGESLSYLPELEDYGTGPDRYLELLAAGKAAVSVPVIGSLNGTTPGGWRQFARQIEEAGADALELNLYHVPTDPELSGADLEARYLDDVREVAAAIRIPLAVKLSPFLTAPVHLARQFVEAGASGLVLFNRFYQPDIDLEELQVVPKLVLSRPEELRLPLRWAAILFGRVEADLAITSGVHNAEDVLKGMLAGGSVTMMTSELLRSGPGVVSPLLDAMREWMTERDYESVAQMRGALSHRHTESPEGFERANYLATLHSWSPDLDK
ncbi:MAG: dihydroorotate dehydrogenase-like protein [Verrucomicrobiales bacterium]